MFLKQAYTGSHMKRYVPIIIGIVALCAVLYVGNSIIKNRDVITEDEKKSELSSAFTGKVIRNFEGENVLEYTFDLPETGTTTLEKDGALVKVTDQGSPVLAMYVSYEGGRGYSSVDYINNVILPNVPSAKIVGTTTVGLYEWDVVESQNSIWHVAKGGDGQWLLVMENTKVSAEKANPIIESLSTQ